MSSNLTVTERFWRKVDKSGDCWLWTGAVLWNGYGSFKAGAKQTGAHRVAYTLLVGPIPDGLFVCHHCDVRNCVRPEHLFLGTHDDNMKDAVTKQRFPSGDRHHSRAHPGSQPRGESNAAAKLSAEQVQEIRNRYGAGGVSQAALGSQYGVHQAQISSIVKGRTWNHLPFNPAREKVRRRVNAEAHVTTASSRSLSLLRRGERNGFAKLTSEQVAEIRCRYAKGGIRQIDLASEYGVIQAHISRLLRGVAWTHTLHVAMGV